MKQATFSPSYYVSSALIFYVSRFWGVAPFSLRKVEDRHVLRWSLGFTIYSFVLGGLFVAGSIQGIIQVIWNRPAQETYFAFFGITLGNIVTVSLIFATPWRVSSYFAYINHLNKVDTMLEITDSKTARSVSLAAILILNSVIFVQVFLSMYFMWLRDPKNILYFLPDNIHQTFILLSFEYQYADMVYSIERRMTILKNLLDKQTSKKLFQPGITLFSENVLLEKKLRARFSDSYGVRLAEVYTRLCDAADCVNAMFCYSIVIVIINGSLKVTEAMFYVIFMIFGKFGLGSTLTQVLWVIFHVFRIIIIVEPCHRCIVQVKKTLILTCKLCSDTDNHSFKTQMRILLKHFRHRLLEFNACNLITFNHKFLAVFMSSTVTYLVIIIQFGKNLKS